MIAVCLLLKENANDLGISKAALTGIAVVNISMPSRRLAIVDWTESLINGSHLTIWTS